MNPCAKCGACSVVCPVFRITGQESHTARGKLHLVTRPDLLPHGKAYEDIFSSCLLCGACSSVCPRGIDVRAEVVRARTDFPAIYGGHGYEKFLARKALVHPEILSGLGVLGRAGREMLSRCLPEKSGLKLRLAQFQDDSWRGAAKESGRTSEQTGQGQGHKGLGQNKSSRPAGLFSHLLRHGKSFIALLCASFHSSNTPRRKSSWGMTENPAQYGTIYSGRGPKGLSFFPGCTAHYLFPRIGEACDVVAAPVAGGLRVPQGLSCCGLAALSAGDMDEARRCARINIEALEPGSGPVLVSCASCYVHLLRYPTLFDDDPVWRGRAERLAARLLELSCFLDHHLPREKEAPSVEKNLRVFYHHPCHLRFGVQIMEEPRRLLGRHPGIQLLELADGPECCGQGGLFHIGSPEIAAAIRDSLATKVLAMNPDVITTSCSGCLLQWRMAMAAADSPVRVLHLAETLRLVKTE